MEGRKPMFPSDMPGRCWSQAAKRVIYIHVQYGTKYTTALGNLECINLWYQGYVGCTALMRLNQAENVLSAVA